MACLAGVAGLVLWIMDCFFLSSSKYRFRMDYSRRTSDMTSIPFFFNFKENLSSKSSDILYRVTRFDLFGCLHDIDYSNVRLNINIVIFLSRVLDLF